MTHLNDENDQKNETEIFLHDDRPAKKTENLEKTDTKIDRGIDHEVNQKDGASRHESSKHQKAEPAVQTIVQINLYRQHGDRFEFLLFKRQAVKGDDEDDRFWQTVSQTVRAGDSIADTLKKAADEQAGISGFMHVSKELYSYDWYSNNDSSFHDESNAERGRDLVFSAEIDPNTPILPDLTRYSTFEWLSFKEALLRLKWDGNKQALRELQDRLEKGEEEFDRGHRQRVGAAVATPNESPTEPAHDNKEQEVQEEQPDKPANDRSKPSSLISSYRLIEPKDKRLPDRPSSKRLPDREEDDPSTSVFPL